MIFFFPWHYNPLNFPAIQSFLVWHVLVVVGMTFLLTWVYNGTGASLGMAVLFHTFSNFSDWVVPTSPLVNGSQQTFIVQVLFNLTVALVVFLVTKDLGLPVQRRSTIS